MHHFGPINLDTDQILQIENARSFDKAAGQFSRPR
jgi:hypothetical protein